jgi:hypothetical protein
VSSIIGIGQRFFIKPVLIPRHPSIIIRDLSTQRLTVTRTDLAKVNRLTGPLFA